MVKRAYNFTQFVDLLLVALYEADQNGDGSGRQNLEALAKSIKGDVPRDWILDAAKVLETRSFARCMYTFAGTFADITGQGRLYVEGQNGFTKEAQSEPANYFNITVPGSGNQVVIGQNVSGVTQTSEATSPAIELLDEILKRIKEDQNVKDETRSEVTNYANLIKFEIAKPEPNRTLIATLLESMSKVASIAGNVASFIRLFTLAA